MNDLVQPHPGEINVFEKYYFGTVFDFNKPGIQCTV